MNNPGGKGSTQRPLNVSQEQFDSNWDAIFKKKVSEQWIFDEVVSTVIHEFWVFGDFNKVVSPFHLAVEEALNSLGEDNDVLNDEEVDLLTKAGYSEDTRELLNLLNATYRYSKRTQDPFHCFIAAVRGIAGDHNLEFKFDAKLSEKKL